MVAEIHALAPEPEDATTAGVLRLKRKPKDGKEKQKRVAVFFIEEDDGTETVYSVPAKPGAEISLKMLEIIEKRGQEAGMYYMLTTMLGQDGYTALMTYEDLPPKALQQVIEKINEIANGAMEGPKAS